MPIKNIESCKDLHTEIFHFLVKDGKGKYGKPFVALVAEGNSAQITLTYDHQKNPGSLTISTNVKALVDAIVEVQPLGGSAPSIAYDVLQQLAVLLTAADHAFVPKDIRTHRLGGYGR